MANEPKAKISLILVINMAGYGYRLYWTLDRITWVNFRSLPMNRAHVEKALAFYRKEQPDVEVRELTDFAASIPADLIVEGTRII